MREATVKVYKVSELNGKAKERALEKLADFNLGFDWWESVFEGLKEDLAKVGIDAGKRVYFDTDRNRHAYCPDAIIVDEKKFLRAAIEAGHKLTKAEIRDALSGEMGLGNDGGRYPDMRVRLRYDKHEALTEFVRDFFHKFLKGVEDEYDYQRSEEVLTDMADANDYEFLEDGRMFNA